MPATQTAPPPPKSARAWSLSIAMQVEKDGRAVTTEPVIDADLADHRAELFMGAFLRNGHFSSPISDMSATIHPEIGDESTGQIRSFSLHTTNPSGDEYTLDFSTKSLELPVARATRRLLESGQLKANDDYFYRVLAHSASNASKPDQAPVTGGEVRIIHKPLARMEIPIAPLIERAKRIGETDDRDFPVFFTAEAHAIAEKLSRRGEQANPPVETGAALIGPLCSCPKTGECFVIVTRIVEAANADQTQFTLSFTDRTWTLIQNLTRVLQSRPATRAFRLLGQCHGHNFLPANGAPPCDLCSKQKECTRTTAFVSTDDVAWSRAVFANEPWRLCQIFGRNARGENVSGLFGLRDGTLIRRGYFVIDQF